MLAKTPLTALSLSAATKLSMEERLLMRCEGGVAKVEVASSSAEVASSLSMMTRVKVPD